MPHDFKPSNKKPQRGKPQGGNTRPAGRRAPAPKKSGLPGGLLVLAIITVSSFAYGLYYLSQNRSPEDEQQSLQAVVKQATQTSTPSVAASDEEGSTQFEFYSLLPQQTPVLASDPKQRTAPSEPARNYHYMLQAGAFKKEADAERRRAELILNGYDAQLEPTKYNNGQTWYRLLIGPFNSQSKLAKARSELLQSNIETLVIKRNN